MSAKRKTTSAKEHRQAMRARYTWYLRPPFNDEFDRTHWWEKEARIDPVAALYELARRHPRVGKLRLKFKRASWYGQELRCPLVGAAEKRLVNQAFDDLGKEPAAIHCLCLIGLKPWLTLGWNYQDFWLESAGKIKGLDCRGDITQCHSINIQAHGELIGKRAYSLKKALNFKKEFNFVVQHLQQNPIPSAEMEAAITRHAVAEHRKGHLLFSVAPDLTLDEAKKLFEREYGLHLKLTPPKVKQRARWENWLPLIEAFENEEAQLGGKKSQVFIRYRRAMEGIRFVPRPGASVTTIPPN